MKAKKLPAGYRIYTWKNASGIKIHSVFCGDDRLMSFQSRLDAARYATDYASNQVEIVFNKRSDSACKPTELLA